MFCNTTFAQNSFEDNGRNVSFPKDPYYSYTRDWSYSKKMYYTVQNDTLYIGIYEDDDDYGSSKKLKFANIYDFQLKSVITKRENKSINLLPIKDDYTKVFTLEFDSEQLMDAFYKELKSAYNTESQQKISNYEKGINDPEEQVAKNTLLEQQNAAASQQKKADEQAKTVYEENYYAFDLALHGVENQFVILSNDKGEECMRVDRLKNEYFRNVNGTWVSKAGVIKNNTQLENYDEIMRTYGKKDTLGVWTLQDDGFNVVQYTETGGIFKYRYFPTKELIKDFDELVGTSNSINYRYDPQTGQIIHFDSKTVYFTVSGGKPSMDELLIMIYLYKSPLFK